MRRRFGCGEAGRRLREARPAPVVRRYRPARLAPDYLRAGLGLVAAGLPLWAFDLPGVVRVVFACLMVLFGGYAIDVARRQRSRVEMRETGLVIHPAGTRIDWSGLTRLRLAYFALRRDGKQGWLELRLDSGPRRVRVDSRLEGFGELVERAMSAARARDLALDPATLANYASLGSRPPPPVGVGRPAAPAARPGSGRRDGGPGR